MKEYVDKLHKSYQMAISAFMDAYPKTDVFLIKQIDNYSRACALYIWTLSDNKPEQYIEPINVIYSEKVGSPNYTIENVKAAIDKLNSRSRSMPVPKFFDRIIDYDLRHMTNYSGRLVRCFQLLNVCYSLFAGAVNKEEAGSMTILQMELSQACNKKGIIPFLLDDPYEYIMPVDTEELFVNASNMQSADINILKSPDYNSRAGRIVVPLGIGDDGKLITCDLGLIPHMLVCGFTGTGKTALIQTILAIMISKKSYQDVKVAIYDSKNLDYIDFHKLPHLCSPVVTDKDGAAKLIDRIESEIHKRFLFLRDINCRDYRQYYEKREEISDRIPELFFIFDDFSSLVLQPEEKDKLLYILINGRVVGVHVILITSTIVSKTLKLDILS